MSDFSNIISQQGKNVHHCEQYYTKCVVIAEKGDYFIFDFEYGSCTYLNKIVYTCIAQNTKGNFIHRVLSWFQVLSWYYPPQHLLEFKSANVSHFDSFVQRYFFVSISTTGTVTSCCHITIFMIFSGHFCVVDKHPGNGLSLHVQAY